MKSILVKKQKKVLNFPDIVVGGLRIDLEVELRYDDANGNGYNTFTMTGTAWEFGKEREVEYVTNCGAIAHIITEGVPKLASLAKWQLMSSSAPFHYIPTTLYWVNESNLEISRRSAIAPDATLKQLSSVEWLENRLPALRKEFRKEMINLGFTY